jgi:hypothetical protein
MYRKGWTRAVPVMLTVATAIGFVAPHAVAKATQSSRDSQKVVSTDAVVSWQTQARIDTNLLLPKGHGTIFIDDKGVVFQSRSGRNQSWAFLDIQTFALAPHRLVLETYTNRSMHLPGEQTIRFDLGDAVPPAVATLLASRVARPSQNAIPDPESPGLARIAVHHRSLAGGTNGFLRFRDGGLDYVTNSPRDSRSWRWEDLQTLSDPDPYHLFVFGYRDTYTFDLKEPLARTLFDRATNKIVVQAEQDSVGAPGARSLDQVKVH